MSRLQPTILSLLLAAVACSEKEAETEGETDTTATAAVEDQTPALEDQTPSPGATETPPPEPEPTAISPTPSIPETAPTTRAAIGNYTVQVSSWRVRSEAERAAESFRRRDYDAYFQRAYLVERDQVWYRVRIGGFETREAAQAEAKRLRAEGVKNAWVDKVREDY